MDARLGIGAVRVKELRFDTEAPLDEIPLTLAKKLDTELGNIVRALIVANGR